MYQLETAERPERTGYTALLFLIASRTCSIIQFGNAASFTFQLMIQTGNALSSAQSIQL